MADVFVSYAGPDEESAQRVFRAIEDRGDSCWFAPEAIRTGDEFAGKITQAINECRVFVILWSKYAASDDRYVKLELNHAANLSRKPRIVIVPVMMDDTPREGSIYLSSLSSIAWNNSAPERIAKQVHEHIAPPKAPYPLGSLYRAVNGGVRSLDRVLEATRLFIRFLTVLQIAWYVKDGPPSEELNSGIEAFLSLDSLFADLDLVRKINKWMIDRRPSTESSFHVLKLLFNNTLPSAREFDAEEQELASAAFDRRNLHKLCGIPDDLGRGSTVSPEDAEKRLCEGALDFLRKALTEPWVEDFALCVQSPGVYAERPKPLIRPIRLSPEEAKDAEIFLQIAGLSIPLSPFLILISSTNAGEWEPGLFRGQEDAARYSPISLENPESVERPALVMPWARIDVVRSVPGVVFVAQRHKVKLTLTNRASGVVTILELCERLPDNLESVEGLPHVMVASGLVLSAGQSAELEYPVAGKDAPETTRSYPKTEVAFSIQGHVLKRAIAGECVVRVRRLPPPLIAVSREIRNRNGEIVASEALLDDELTVTTELKSRGAPVQDLELQEQVDGAEIVAGETSFRGARLERCDLQPPQALVYRIRLNSVRPVAVKTLLLGPGTLTLDAPESHLSVRRMPPPQLKLRWKRASATGDYSLRARLSIENTGGTGAYALAFRTESPEDVVVNFGSGPSRLEPGGLAEVDAEISWLGLPSNATSFTVSCHSVEGASIEDTLTLNLNQVVESDFSRIPFVGRRSAREAIRKALRTDGVIAFTVYGERGAGKKRALQSEINSLIQQEGWQIAVHEVDCEATDLSDALARIVRKIIFLDAPPDAIGSETAAAEFLRGIKMDGEDFKWDADHLKALIHGGTADKAIWRSAGLFLSKVAAAKHLDRLVLVLRTASRFSKAEMEPLSLLRSFFQDSPKCATRFVLTAQDPLRHQVFDCEIHCKPLTSDECNELIDSVFIMPHASSTMRQALIEKSEGIPANLVSFLRLLVEQQGTLLDFGNPAGVQIRDDVLVEELPTSFLEFERRAAECSEVPPGVLACLAAAHEPLAMDQLRKLLQRMNQDLGEESLRKSIDICKESHWVRDSGESKVEITSGTVCEALSLAASTGLLERAHWALYCLFEEEKRPIEKSLTHLVQSPAHLVEGRSGLLAIGLRQLLNNEKFSQVRAMLARLRTGTLHLDQGVRVELKAIELELQWEEKGELPHEQLSQLMRESKGLKDRAKRAALRTRLSLLESRRLARNGEFGKAAEVVEKAMPRIGLLRRRLNLDPRLEFDYYLNLWTIYYRLEDQTRFCRLDRWVWKWLELKRCGEFDAYAIARFLGCFLEFQQEIPTQADREARFPCTVGTVFGETRKISDNKIEVATRPERIFHSFLNEILANPDKLNRPNTLAIGRLYLNVGATLWSQSKTVRQLEGSTGPVAEDAEGTALSYLERAEKLFHEGRFPLYMGNARLTIGRTYADRLLLAEKAGDFQKLKAAASLAERWLQLAAEGFDAIGAVAEALDAWEAYAAVLFHLTSCQPNRRDDAIRAYQRLVQRKVALGNASNRDALRFTLVQLYDEAGRLAEATSLLREMDFQTPMADHLRALIRAEALFTGAASISENEAPEFEADLESLRRAEPITRAVKSRDVQLATSAEAIGVIAWHLSAYYLEQQEGEAAHKLLREYRAEMAATPAMLATLRKELPDRLLKLWQMEGAPAGEMMQDFSSQLMPLLEPAANPAIDRIPERIWSEEFKGAQDAYRAAAEIQLILCEWYFERNFDSTQGRDLARGALEKLSAAEDWGSTEHARLVARSLAFMLRCGVASRDDRVLREDLDPLINILKSEKMYDPALRVMIFLVEMLLDAHRATQNTWYFDVIKQLSGQLEALQELSSHQFEDVTRLIDLYLQLPGRVTDAADLMEKQCRHLLAMKDFDMLPNYLSFLSDLLGHSLRGDTMIANLLRYAESREGSENILEQLEGGSGKTKAVRRVAQDLCGRIIAEVKSQPLGRRDEASLLYNATKLLKDPDSASLAAAVYVKLFDLSNEVDGSCVWGAYCAWSESIQASAAFSLEDQIALTTYSNCQDETPDGAFESASRNYLINARERNRLFGKLAKQHSEDRELSLTHVELEIQRLKCLVGLIHHLREDLNSMSEFERVAWEIFMYDYVAPGAEAAPSYLKVERIEKEGKALNRELQELAAQLDAAGPLGFYSFEQKLDQVSYRVQKVLTDNRRRGGEIMSLLVQRMRPFELSEVLGEVQRYLEGSERSVDFGAVLGLWVDGAKLESFEDGAGEDFLNQNPRMAVKPLLVNGAALLDQGEASLAEKMYRCAIQICREFGDQDGQLSWALRGMTLSLYAQDKFDEACAMAQREVDERGEDDPELGVALEHLAAALEAIGQPEKAISALRRKLEIERGSLNSEDFAIRLTDFAEFLRRNGQTAEADRIEPQAESILREAIGAREKATGPDSLDTLRAVRALAKLLDESGRESESRPLHLREIAAISSRTDANPIDLRGAALSCVLIGEFQLAESLLERVLLSGFEIAGTHCHLARVMLLSNRESDARRQIELASRNLDEAEHYVALRVIWFQILFALLDGKDSAPLLGSLRNAFNEKGAHMPWTMAPVLQVVEPRLKSDDFVLLKALAEALDSKKGKEKLVTNPQWLKSAMALAAPGSQSNS